MVGYEAALVALIMNLYFEGRGEGEEGMRAIADTVITRTHDERWPNDVTEVVLQKGQFTWVQRKKVKDVGDLVELQASVLRSKQLGDKDLEAYRVACKIAIQALSKGYKPHYRFTHFHRVKSHSKHHHHRRGKGVIIGHHIYLRV